VAAVSPVVVEALVVVEEVGVGRLGMAFCLL